MIPDVDCLTANHLILEISSAQRDLAWHQSRRLSTPHSQWQGYLNQLCLDTLLPWLREGWDAAAKPVLPMAAQLSQWELVSGSAIALPSQRLILLPTEAIDDDELRVPQEWVDIPSWRGDYYWGVQIDPDDGWLRVLGLTTHAQLKQQRGYDWRDRTYTLAAPQLIPDLSVLRVAQTLQMSLVTQVDCPSLPAIAPAQAQMLIQRLGTPSLLQPRLEVSFDQWGTLVANGGWRSQLAERRWGLPEQRRVTDWLATGIQQGLAQLGWQQIIWQTESALARGVEADTPAIAFSKSFDLQQVPHELRVMPLDDANHRWRFVLQCQVPGCLLAAGTRLVLLTEDLQPFDDNQEVAEQPVDQLTIDLALETGEGIVWSTVPSPDEYDVEILRF